MDLNKWSPLRSTRSDVFRTMEDNHNSLHLPTKAAAEKSTKAEASGHTESLVGLPIPIPSPPRAAPRAA